MRIACPSCTATYEVPSSRMKPNRMVRCERCGNEWAAVQDDEHGPDRDAPSGTEDHEDPHDLAGLMVSQTDRLTAHVPPPRSVALMAAWLASAVVLAGGLTATLIFRADLARAWPASARLFGDPPPIARPGPPMAGKAASPTAGKPAPGPTEKTVPPRG